MSHIIFTKATKKVFEALCKDPDLWQPSATRVAKYCDIPISTAHDIISKLYKWHMFQKVILKRASEETWVAAESLIPYYCPETWIAPLIL